VQFYTKNVQSRDKRHCLTPRFTLPEQKIDDRFITDYDQSIIGYGKKSSFTTLINRITHLCKLFSLRVKMNQAGCTTGVTGSLTDEDAELSVMQITN